MTTKIRRGVFETNSSSTHSLLISKDDSQMDGLTVEDGICRVYGGEFGWGPEIHKDSVTKASYCLTWVKTVSIDEKKRQRFLDTLSKVIKKETGATTVVFRAIPRSRWDDDEALNWGYIDHQSIEDGEKSVGAAAFESAETLKNFIFNRKSLLIIDNDNH